MGGTHSLAGEGVRGSQFQRGDGHCGTLGIQYMYFVDTGVGAQILCGGFQQAKI
jgi:hypothetical protein